MASTSPTTPRAHRIWRIEEFEVACERWAPVLIAAETASDALALWLKQLPEGQRRSIHARDSLALRLTCVGVVEI